MREVPKKNYITMFIIIISIVITTVFLAYIYNNRLKKTSTMYNYLSEIKKNDIDTYLIEKPNIILYIADKYDVSNEEIEKKLKQEMIDNNIVDYFVFLNLNNNGANFIEELNRKFEGNIKQEIPVIIVFEEGKIKNTYYDLKNIDLKEITGEIK